MKYCVSYYKNFRYNDIIDEVILFYQAYKETIVDQIDNWNGNQRIIIQKDIVTEADLPIIKMCHKKHNNLAMLIKHPQEDIIRELWGSGIPFFYQKYSNTADEVYSFIRQGVSDVYITESLCFDLINISEYCKKNDVQVRVIPNMAQFHTECGKWIPDACKFFIRPEDTSLYEPYVDVFEFITNTEKLSVVYEVYKNKQWLGDLKDLISGLNTSFYNTGITPYFGQERLKCRQRCMQEKCNLCLQMQELSEKFNNSELEIIIPKDKEWKHETRAYKELVQSSEAETTEYSNTISEE